MKITIVKKAEAKNAASGAQCPGSSRTCARPNRQ